MSLAYGTLRYHLHRQLLLAAQVGAQVGIVSDQVTALAAGRPVTVTSAQLRMFTHADTPSEAELDATSTWLLTGDGTLTAVTS